MTELPRDFVAQQIRDAISVHQSMLDNKELIAEIGTENVGFVLDSWHWYTAGETSADLLTLNSGQVVACDLNDAPAGLAVDKGRDDLAREALQEKRRFSGFAESLIALSPGQWHGPVLSGYGVHLVYVHNISESPAPVFADVRERVQQDWQTEKGNELNEQFYANLRERYTIVIEKKQPKDDELAAMQESTQ